MITLESIRKYPPADIIGDTGLGNKMFQIAGTIGIAKRNNLEYGFEEWESQKYFKNRLPEVDNSEYILKELPWGYSPVDTIDKTAIQGYMQDYRYWHEYSDIIRYYFEMQDICQPLTNTIGIHFRAYGETDVHPECDWSYYDKAIMCMPAGKRLVVFTDNIERAKKVIKFNCEFRSGVPIEDFYLLSRCDAVICSNSTFPWWAAWLSGGKTIIPSRWFGGRKSHLSTTGLHYPNWIKI